jgi:hypothetical protein
MLRRHTFPLLLGFLCILLVWLEPLPLTGSRTGPTFVQSAAAQQTKKGKNSKKTPKGDAHVRAAMKHLLGARKQVAQATHLTPVQRAEAARGIDLAMAKLQGK